MTHKIHFQSSSILQCVPGAASAPSLVKVSNKGAKYFTNNRASCFVLCSFGVCWLPWEFASMGRGKRQEVIPILHSGRSQGRTRRRKTWRPCRKETERVGQQGGVGRGGAMCAAGNISLFSSSVALVADTHTHTIRSGRTVSKPRAICERKKKKRALSAHQRSLMVRVVCSIFDPAPFDFMLSQRRNPFPVPYPYSAPSRTEPDAPDGQVQKDSNELLNGTAPNDM